MLNTNLTIITAVKAGEANQLRADLAAIPTGDNSPFASVPGTHNGRWAVVDTSPDPAAVLRAGGLRSTMLACSAVISTTPREWLEALLAELGPRADEIWGHCAGWPSANRLGYLLDHRMRPHLEFATCDVTVHSVLDALAQRERLVDFAIKTQGSSAAELLRAFQQQFRP